MGTFLALTGADGIRGWTLVDRADHDALVVDGPWHFNAGRGYAYRAESIGGQRTKKVPMHRDLLGLTDPKIDADHINRNRLDNRRLNLRAATRAENSQNTSSHRDARSPHRGVDFHRATARWRARVSVGGRTHNLGYFETEEGAAEAAREGRRRLMPFATD